MALGPIIIFDKSTLQGLSLDESVWLENFYLTNITPLFFTETLADLEKEIRTGRTPEQVVGDLARKTPDMSSYPNMYHRTLLLGELIHESKVDMQYGRPHISGGSQFIVGDKKGIMHKQAPETEAFHRWQRGEFLDLERQTAKAWRKALSNINHEENYKLFQQWFIGRAKPKTLIEVKAFAESIIDDPDQANTFQFGLSFIGIAPEYQKIILDRWNAGGKLPIQKFAPYFRHVILVDLFFYLAIASDLISRVRPSNKIDLAYLYYLPFCMVFTSNDNLHAKVAPLFLRKNQTFVLGTELKEDLKKLDQHFSAFPDEFKNQGLFKLAPYPPTEGKFLTSELWDKYLPAWRKNQAEKIDKAADEKQNEEILKEMKRVTEEAVPMGPEVEIDSDAAHHVLFERKVYSRKGKWKRFPPEVENVKNETK